MRLVIIRHGQSEWNKLNLFTGWSDVDLSPEGKKEARLAGKALNEEEIDKSEKALKESDILISQFETPEEITLKAFKKAKEFGKVTILNPAPNNCETIAFLALPCALEKLLPHIATH